MTRPCLPPEPAPSSPSFDLPHGSVDCHMHLFGRAPTYPYVHARDYTPAEDNVAAARSLYQTFGITRFVAVQPSVYGGDNRAQLELAPLVGLEFRAIAVVPADISEREIARLHEQGVRGIRFVLAHPGGLDPAGLERAAARAGAFGWHLELLAKAPQVVELAPRLAKLACPISIDHMGFVSAADGVAQPGFQALLGLLRHEHVWVKFSGAYRVSGTPDQYDALQPFARALLKAAPDRIVWGSDWPHVGQMTTMPRTTPLLDLLVNWVPDPHDRQRILVTNPERLYDFAAGSPPGANRSNP